MALFITAEVFAGVDMTIFGPKRYDRPKGAPASYADTFERCEPSDRALVRVSNGSGKSTSVTAGKVLVNGSAVFSESDFKNQLPLLEREITINRTNQLAVELKSGGSDTPFVIVEIIGRGCDSTPPSIFSPAPADGSLLNTATPPISAGYADDARGSGIDPASVRLIVDGADRTASAAVGGSGVSFNPSPLPEGGHSVTVSVSDRAANVSSLAWNFTTDTVPPVIAIQAPAAGFLTNVPAAVVSGTVSEPHVTVTVNGVAATVEGTGFSATVPLSEGNNTLTVTASDRAGNSGSGAVLGALDTISPAPPVLALQKSPTNVAATVLSGTAEANASVRISTGGALLGAVTADTQGSFTLPGVTLAEGTNSFSATATDAAGNESSVSQSMAVALDTKPPVVKITSHAGGQYLNTPGITLGGTLDDPAASVTVSGQPATVNGSTFTTTLSLTEGPNTLTAVATDPAGNSGTDSIVLNLDTIPPQLAVSTLSDGSYTNSETLNISGMVTDAGGLDKLLINGAVVPVNADGSYSHALILQAGANAITVEAIDKAANKSESSRTINLDQAAPQLTITAPADNSKTGERLVEITGSVNEPLASLTVNGAAVPLTSTSASTWTFTATVIPDYGYNTIEITARDRAGNPGTQKRTVIFDDKKPAAAITEPAQDLRTNISSLTLKGTASDADGLTAVGVTVTMDGATFTPPVANGAFEQALTFGEEKSYAIAVTARDEAGNETIIQRNVIYDITPPAVTVSTFDSPVNQESQVITGTREAGVAITITSATAVIGAITYGSDTTWQATVTGLGADKNDIVVTAADLAGNLGNTSTRIVYDNTPPVITVATPAADAFLNSPQIAVTGTVSEPVASVTVNGVTASLTGNSFSAVITLAEGANSIAVSAVDLAGNSGTTAVPVILDTAPPVITVSAPMANAFLKTPQINVSGTLSEPVTAVTVNGQQATVNGLTFSATLTLAEGANTLTVKALDPAGNEGTAALPVNLDTLLPVVTIAAPSSGLLTKTPQVTVSGTVSEENTTVTVNGQPAAVNALTFTTTLTLAEGQNTINVRAVDRAGNSGTAAVTVSLDSTTPAAPVLATQKTPTNVAAIAISGTAEAGSIVKISAAGALLGTVTADAQGNFSLANVTLADGSNSYTATATDAAGNESPVSAPLTIVLDTVKPVITIAAPLPGVIISSAAVQLSGTVDEPLASLTINGATVSVDSNSTFTSTLTLAAGPNSALITAVDLAGNAATVTLTIVRDSTPPAVVITTPLPGLLTKNSAVQVSGTVDDAEAAVTVNGQQVTVNGSTFSFTYTLSDGDNAITVEATDKAGNRGSASVTVTLDAIPPTLALAAPVEAIAGANLAISLSAGDNRGLALVELKADGVPIWSGNSAPAISEAVAYRLSPALNAGSVVTLQAKGSDAAGNEGTASATVQITQAAMGPGYIQGKVLDDSRGLKLAGAEVLITQQLTNSTNSLTSQTDGGYFLETPAGSALVKIAKPGYTTVERQVPVIPEKNITVLDARLTKIDETKNLIDAAGGTAKVALASPSAFSPQPSASSVELILLAGAVNGPVDLRLTPISNQGLAGLLPLGWSPLAAVDVRTLDPVAGTALETTLATAATVKLPIPASVTIDPAAPPILARYDNSAHQWLAGAAATVAADSLSATAEITAAGQYALVLADPAPAAPPTPVMGGILQPSALNLQPDFTLIVVTGKVVPQASPPSTGLKAAGEVVLAAKEGATPTFTSGLLLSGRITEKFDLKSGDKVEAPLTSQDLVLYRTPCATNIGSGAVTPLAVSGAELRTTFPVSPSKDYTIVDLLLGKVGIEIVKPDTSETGVMVGPDGGRLVDADGNILAIPQGALSLTTPISTKTAAAASGAVGSDFILIRAVEVNLTRQTLAASATLSIPAPDGFNPSLPLIVAKQIDVKGVAKLKLVALARQSGTLISSAPLTPELSNSTNSINSGGVYYFLQAKGQLGFITGTVTDSGSAPFTGALVKSDTGSLVDLSTATGKYLLAAPVAPFIATATDLYKGDEVSATSAITTGNQAVTVDLKILMIPPTVTAITPANGAVNVQPTVPVVVTFSKTMDQSSINSQTLKLTNTTNSEPVPGSLTFSIDNKTVTFYPSDAFKQETSYTVTIAASVKDLQGYPLGQDVTATFTVRKTTPPAMPPAGSISGTFPDVDGFITVTATQGSANPADTVLLINDTTGEITSVTPQTNGSFTGKVRGQLGDEIKVVLMDYSGNQTVISYLTFKNTDGSYLVTTKGGKVEGEGGSILDIPEGALVGPAIIKVTQLPEAALPHPVPEGGSFLGATNIDTGGIAFLKEVHLSIPVPSGHNPDTPVFVTKPREVVNADGTTEKVYEIIDSTKILSGRLTTASPPFSGIMDFGMYAWVSFPTIFPAIVSGYTYKDMDGDSTFTDGVDLPVKGAIVRAPGSWNYVSYSNLNGFYATFSSITAGIGTTCMDYSVTAVHPQTMYRKTIKSAICEPPYNVKRLNFKLADRDSTIPDKTAPLINFNLQVAPGQPPEARFTAGTVPVGTEIQVPLSVIDQEMGIVTLTVLAPGAAFSSSVPLNQDGYGIHSVLSADRPAIFRYNYSPLFPAPINGSVPAYFRPDLPGVYIFTVESKDAAGNISRVQKQIRAVEKGATPGGIDGPPTVDMVSPADGARDIMVTTPVTVYFSEPVDNVIAYSYPLQPEPATFILIDTTTGNYVPSTVSTGLEAGRMQATLTPKGNLYYDREYKVVLTRGITDANPNPSSDNKVLPLKDPFQSTFRTKTPKAYDLSADEQFTGGWDIALYNDLEKSRSYTYITEMDKGWKAVDVTDPTKPSLTFTQPQLGSVNFRYAAVEPQLKILGITESLFNLKYGYIRFYDLTHNPESPVKVGQEKLAEEYSGVPSRLALSGKYAYVATTQVGVQVVDIDIARENISSGRPSTGQAIVGIFDPISQNLGQPWDITVYGNGKGLLTTSTGYLLTLDLSTPVAPQLMKALRNPPEHPDYKATRVAAVAEYAYSDADNSVQIMDLAVTASPLGRVNTVDLTDPYNPRVIGTAKDASGAEAVGYAKEITVSKDAGLAYVTTYNSIQVYDIKDPSKPKLLNEIKELPDPSGALNPDGTPVMIPIGDTPAIVEKGGWVYMASQAKGFRALDLDPVVLTLDEPVSIRIDTPMKGKAINNEVYFTYTLTPQTKDGFDSATSVLTVTESETNRIILEKTNIPHTAGKHVIRFMAKDIGWEFDVTKRYTVKIYFDSKPEPLERIARIPLEWQAIATDYDRNGTIDDSDMRHAAEGNINRTADAGGVFPDAMNRYYFWINDNADVNDIEGNSIPGSGKDYEKTSISGTRDLVDYFPVLLKIGDVIQRLTPDRYSYILKQGQEAANYLDTVMNSSNSRKYLTDVDFANNLVATATKAQITDTGTPLDADTIENLRRDGVEEVVLIDGRMRSRKPLILEVKDKIKKDVAFRTELPLSIDDVENMFRHKNLIRESDDSLPEPEAGTIWGMPDRLETPLNAPNFESDKNFVLVHGYNVNGNQARGWQSEIFKRMYWSGSKARFWGVTWYGSKTQTLGVTPNYHTNAVNALKTARALADFLNNKVGGEITILGHSLGNMVVSSAISEHGAKVKNYFMVDAAVASEAYGAMALERKMDHPEWAPPESANKPAYDSRLFASEWYRLFQNDAPADNRVKLTWRNKFANRGGATFYNFYSSGEEVLDLLDTDGDNPSIFNFGYGLFDTAGRYAWALQELLKGRLPFGIMIGSKYGGWGFNLSDEDHYYTERPDTSIEGLPEAMIRSKLKPEETTFILNNISMLRTKPFFSKESDDAPLFTESSGSSHASTNMERLLAGVFPARTAPAGKIDISVNADKNYDMQAEFKTGGQWPNERGEPADWLHSDIRNVSYPYIYDLFNKFIELGVLK